MSTYRVADGHDVALGSLTVLDPQPRTELVQPTQRGHAASGVVYDQGLHVVFLYSMVPSVSDYQSILTDFGIYAAETNEVTVYVRNAVFDWTRYNGLAIQPQPGQDLSTRNYFPRDVQILVRDLVESS